MWTEEALDSLIELLHERLASLWTGIRDVQHSAYVVSTLTYSASVILQTDVTDSSHHPALFRTYLVLLEDHLVICQPTGSVRINALDFDQAIVSHFDHVLFGMVDLGAISPTECLVAITSLQPDSKEVDATL